MSIFFLLLPLLIITPNIIFQLSVDRFEYPKSIFALTTILVYLVCLSFFIFKKKTKGFLKVRVFLTDVFIILFSIIFLLSLAFSASLYGGIAGAWEHPQGGLVYLLPVIFCFIYLFRNFSGKNLRVVLMFISLGALIAVIWPVLNGELNLFLKSTLRIRSTQGQPIYFSIYLMICFFCSLGLLVNTSNKFIKVALMFLCSVIAAGVLISLTRGVWISFIVTLFIFLILIHKEYKKLLNNKFNRILVGYSLVCLILSFFYFHQLIISRLKTILLEPFPYNSALVRLTQYNSALKIIKDYSLLGTGPEAIYYIYPRYRSAELNQHDREWFWELNQIRNLYLHYGATLGIFGLLAFLAIIFSVIYSVFKNFKKISDEKFYPMFLGTFLAWLSLVINNLFYGATVTSQLFFWLLMGMLLGVMYKSHYIYPIRTFSITLFRISNKVLGTIILIGGVTGIFIIGTDFLSNITFFKALSNPNINEASVLTKKAISINPLRTQYYQTYAYMMFLKINPLMSDKKKNQQEIEFLLKEAQVRLTLARLLDPEDPRLAHYQAIYYYQNARLKNPGYYIGRDAFDPAIVSATEAHLKDPTNPIVLDLLTQVYLEMGHAKLMYAEDVAKMTIRLKSNYSPARYHLGEALKQQGRFNDAIQSYMDVLKYDPNDEFAKQEIEKIIKLKSVLQ